MEKQRGKGTCGGIARTVFDVLLGLSLNVEAAVGLDAERQVLIHKGQEYTFETMLVPKSPTGAICTVLYALKHCRVPAQGKSVLKIAAFEQGQHGGHVHPEMPRFVQAKVPLYYWSNPEGQIEPWEVTNSSNVPVEIQAGQ